MALTKKLTNIADAIRTQTPTEYKIIEEQVLGIKVSKTSNATGFDTYSGNYGNSSSITDEITFIDADEIRVKIAYQTEGINYDYVTITPRVGEPTEKLGGKTLTVQEFTFPGADAVSFYFKTDGSGNGYLGYYAEVTGIKYIKEELPKPTYTLDEMATTISNLNVVPEGTGVVSGDISYLLDYYYTFNKGTSDYAKKAYAKLSGDVVNAIVFKDITNAYRAFCENTYVKYLPEINLAEGGEGKVSSMCQKAANLLKAPKITGKIKQMDSLFADCTKLQNVSEIVNYEFDEEDRTVRAGALFSSCAWLKEIPSSFLKRYGRLHNTSSSVYCPTYSVCYGMYSLGELVDYGVTTETMTASRFFNVAYNAYRLKRWTFETNEDGTPKTANWHTQTLDFSETAVGYSSGTLMTNYGFLLEERITDDASYQTLKDNPNSWTTAIAYSRYNHDSAVETINSLPDTSAFLAQNSGKTNTIKFKGSAGSSTDGGAINTLTEEEIAVATAKGWTVTLV